MIQVLEQGFGVLRDPQEPLIQLALFHQCTGSPGTSVGIHLLVGQNGLIHWIPVDRCVLPVGQTAIEQLQEQPLGPAVVIAVAGGLLTVPVDRQAEAIQLRSHLIDVAIGPIAGINVAFDCSIFGGKTEGIPSHRVQHRAATHPLNAGDHIGDDVIAHMAHVQGP